MINYDYISGEVKRLKRKYEETDPDRLCRLMGITVIDDDTRMQSADFKGLTLIQSRMPVILLNSKLSESLRQIVLAHALHSVVNETEDELMWAAFWWDIVTPKAKDGSSTGEEDPEQCNVFNDR